LLGKLLRRLRQPWFSSRHGNYSVIWGRRAGMKILDDAALQKRGWLPLSDDELRWHPIRALSLPDETPMLVQIGDGGSWALPWSMMLHPHVANLVLAGRPVVISACANCMIGAAFDPVVQGQRLLFRVIGIWNGVSVLADQQSGSYWNTSNGEAIHGPLKGTRLAMLPMRQLTIAQLQMEQPDCWVGLPIIPPDSLQFTPVSHKPTNIREAHSELTDLLPWDEPVLGVSIAGAEHCYPLAQLDATADPLHDNLAGEELVILFGGDPWSALAYSRRLDGTPLNFIRHPEGVRDTNSGTLWNFNGEAVAGPHRGRHLEYLPSAVQRWYAWIAYHPNTTLSGTSPP